ncbi:MAG: hypothetical protein KA063_06610 [Firmicutes bacterium]|nr:hypothetical protein [Bacillota bacterium]
MEACCPAGPVRRGARPARAMKTLLLALGFVLVMYPVPWTSAAEISALPLQIRGDVEFKIRSAWGDSIALAGTGYSPGHVDIAQLLSLSVRGQVAPGISVSGTFDNRKDGNLQLLELTLDGDPFKGKFGGLAFRSENPYAAYSSRLRGLEVRAEYPAVQAGVTVGRVQGIPAKKTFQGSTAQEMIVYEPKGTYAPAPASTGLAASLDGMEYYELGGFFDPDYMGAWMRYVDCVPPDEERTLKHTLDAWDLGYLYLDDPEGTGVISAGDGVALSRGQFVTVSSTSEMLALRSEVRDALRGQIQSLIRSYNTKNLLAGSDQKRYPFICGSETESVFLEDLLRLHARIVAGAAYDDPGALLDVPATSYSRRRLYDMGQTDVVAGSVTVEVRRGGQYYPADTQLALGFQTMYDTGVIEFDFPTAFFDTYDGIRVKYRHTVAHGIFNLGISIALGSERVYLNDNLLKRDQDYVIDYEFGILTILMPLGPDDIVRVEYEYFRGPFGAPADYKSNFFGAVLGWTPNEQVKVRMEIARYADDPKSAALPEATPVMPNAHTVIGLSGRFDNKGLSISGDLALSHDEFPFDDNRKSNAANAVLGVMAAADADSKPYLALAHRDGISVGAAGVGDFRRYGVGSGLAGPVVRAMAASDDGTYTWFFATDGGLTVLSALPGPAGQSPFDYVGNWRRVYTSAGLPSNDLTSVALTPWEVWVGTVDDGVATAHVDDLENWTVYKKSSVTGLPSDSISAIAYDPLQDVVMVATDRGLASFQGGHFDVELPGTSVQAAVSGVEAVAGLRTFAATDTGVYGRDDSGQWSRVVADPAAANARAITVWNGALWIGTDNGLFAWDGSTLIEADAVSGYSVTSLGAGPGLKYDGQVLWVGTRARPDDNQSTGYAIDVFEIVKIGLTKRHSGSDLEISAEDPRRYLNLSPDEHTVTGYAARASARYAIGAGSMYGSYEAVTPTFTKLGQTSRQGLDTWRIGALWPLGSRVSLSAEHSEARTQSYSGKPDQAEPKELFTISSRLAGSLDIGAKIDVSYTTSRVDDAVAEGFEREEHTISVGGRQTFFNGALSLGAGYDNTESVSIAVPSSSYTQISMRGDATLKLDALSVTARYRKPIKTIAPGKPDERRSGSEEISVNAQWAKQLGTVSVRATYRQLNRSDLATQRKLDDKRADVRATLPALKLGAGTFTPSAVLRWEQVVPFSGQMRRIAGAQTSLSGMLGAFRTTSGVGLTRTEYPEIRKVTLDSEVFLTLGGGVAAKFAPQVDVRWKRSTSQRPDLGDISTDSLTGTLRGAWTPRHGLANVASASYTLSASASGEKHTLSLSDSLSAALSSKATATVDVSATSTAPAAGLLLGGAGAEVRGDIKGGVRYKITDVWSLGATAGYSVRLLSAGGAERLKSAVTLEAGLRAIF